MKKLYIDELIADTRLAADVRTELQQSRVFLIQNILSAIPEKIDPAQLPQLAPPYENCWFEWTVKVKKRDDAPTDFSEITEMFDERMLDIMLNLEGDMRLGVNLTSWHGKDSGWFLFLRPFMRMGSNKTLFIPYRYFIQINADGYLPDGELNVNLNFHEKPDAIASEMIKNDDAIQEGFVNPVLYGLALLNCKNVVTVERGVPPEGIKRNRNRTWKHRHYVLQIRPMREITKIEHDGESITQDISYHFCRGHFKTYTAEKPLFGKYVGTFRWDAHARGSIKTGIVTKDYNVNPPENDGSS